MTKQDGKESGSYLLARQQEAMFRQTLNQRLGTDYDEYQEIGEMRRYINFIRQQYGVSHEVAELLYVADLDASEISVALAHIANGHDTRWSIRHAHRSVMDEDTRKSFD